MRVRDAGCNRGVIHERYKWAYVIDNVNHGILYDIPTGLTVNIRQEKSGNGGGDLPYRCAGGRGNTTHTPEAGEVRLQSPDSLGKEHV